jgi:hypothetical protein
VAIIAAVKRAFLTTLPLVALGCGGRATRAECTQMLDKYVDMVVQGDPELANLSPEAARAAREMKKAVRKGDPSFRRVEDQCEAEISKREFRCAMKSPTPETWQACID